MTCFCTCSLLYWPTVIYLWYLIWHGVSLVTNCLCRKKHKHQKGKRFGHKWGPSSVPTILICIKNNNYKLNKQNSCNLIIILFFCFFLIINLFIKVELEHANSSSIVLTQKSSPVRFVENVNCGTHHLKGTQPQLIPKKAQNINPIVSPRWRRTAQHTHARNREVKGEFKLVEFEFGENFLLLFSSTESTDRLVVCHSVSRQRENWFRKYWKFSV